MRKSFLILVLTISLTVVNADEVHAVNIDPNKIELVPLDIDQAESIQAIRLYREKQGIALVSSSTKKTSSSTSYQIIISSKLIDKSPQKQSVLLTVNQLLAVHPRWDIVETEGGSYRFITEQSGGATIQLMCYEGSSQPYSITTKYFLNSFSNPRFVIDEPNGSMVEVTATLDDEKFVLFSRFSENEGVDFIEIGH